MTTILYRQSALSDLAGIQRYYASASDAANERVYADIYATIEILKLFPFAGHELPDGRRRIVTQRYRFVISHKARPDQVEIVGVYRQQNR